MYTRQSLCRVVFKEQDETQIDCIKSEKKFVKTCPK